MLMISYDDVKKIYEHIKKDKIMMWVFRILLIAATLTFIIATTLALKDGSNGKHVKLLWGLLERNIPKEHPDTIRSFIPQKIDTIIVYKERIVTSPSYTQSKRLPIVTPAIKKDNLEGDNNAVGRDNSGVQGGKNNKSHIISGNDNKVGVNGDIINGIKQRHLTKELFNEITSHIPNKSTHIVLYGSASNKETYNYENEIYRELLINGYRNITGTNWMDPYGG
jgi:hypothetical protein